MPLTASMRMDILLNGDDRVIKIEGNDVPVGTISTHFSTENDITTYYHLEMCDDIHYDIRDAMPSEGKPATHFPYKEAAPCVFWASIKRTVGCVSCKTPLFTGGRFPTVTMLLDGTEYTVEFPAGHSVFRQVDGLKPDPALLEVALRLFCIEAFAFSENLNVQ